MATNSAWAWLAMWPLMLWVVLIVGSGMLILIVIRRVLFGPMNDKPLHDRQHDSTANAPDAWTESARRLKIDPDDTDDTGENPQHNDDDPDHPPGGESLEDPPRRPLDPPR